MVEPLSKRSKLVTASHTSALNICDTVLSFEDYYETKVYPTTPCRPDCRQWTFDCLPTPSSELHLSECEVVASWKLLKKDNSPIDERTQIGCLQVFVPLRLGL